MTGDDAVILALHKNFRFLVWEISTGRCIKTIDTGDIVRSVAWCPNGKISLIAVASGQRLILLNPKVGDKMLVKKTDEILLEAPKSDALGKHHCSVSFMRQWRPIFKPLNHSLFISHFQTMNVSKLPYSGRRPKAMNTRLVTASSSPISNRSNK